MSNILVDCLLMKKTYKPVNFNYLNSIVYVKESVMKKERESAREHVRKKEDLKEQREKK